MALAPASSRLYWVDVLRGLAILLMIPANLSPYFTEPHPMWYRILGSFAAPTFIALSAGMVVLRGADHPFVYYLRRGLLVTCVGMLLDAGLWSILPWTSFDVLYIIGPGMILGYFARRWKPAALFAGFAVFAAVAMLLQKMCQYDPVPLQIYWSEFSWPETGRLFVSWFVDGWFPIFPWMGFVLFGAGLFGLLLRTDAEYYTTRLLISGFVLAVLGFILLFVAIPGLDSIAAGSVVENRDGYSEIFYPPSLGYLLAAAGLVILSALALRRMPRNPLLSAISFFGRYSMMVYILHQALGAQVIAPILEARGLESIDSGLFFTTVNFLVVLAIALICGAIGLVKKRYPPRALPWQILFGR